MFMARLSRKSQNVAMKIRLYQQKDAPQLRLLLKEFLQYTQKTYDAEARQFTRTRPEKERAYINNYVSRFTQLKIRDSSLLRKKEQSSATFLVSLRKTSMNTINVEATSRVSSSQKNSVEKHIGKQLYDELVAWFKKKGCSQLILEVAKGNPACSLYKKWGFQCTREEMRRKL
jgi:predicted PolB exonuclease-like 3'-5' exonuclease